MRAVLLLLACICVLRAQPLPQGKPVTGIEFDSKGLIDAINPTIHIHFLMHGSCKGEPDHVYGHSDNIYYACISEQDVCTVAKAHNGVGVPRALITQYEQVRKLQEAERQKFEEGRAEREAQAAASRQRSEAISNEVRTARAQGRQPNLAQFGMPGAPATPAPRKAAVGTVAQATVQRATITLLPDEKLEGIATGAKLADVQRTLGNPYSRIAGDSERWTYRLESGKTARLEFEGGVLARIEVAGGAR